eukprot:TRINITY_DN2543_c0_g1_i10.p1 TRINITY_DN2543_c0_g1~~TRINITY_DN2543_c0_g1_i10.p1  ORF type:complete len:3016 (-),score=1204.04 TRINITY_DN2543_c0_g1_i10:107-9154(-)
MENTFIYSSKDQIDIKSESTAGAFQVPTDTIISSICCLDGRLFALTTEGKDLKRTLIAVDTDTMESLGEVSLEGKSAKSKHEAITTDGSLLYLFGDKEGKLFVEKFEYQEREEEKAFTPVSQIEVDNRISSSSPLGAFTNGREFILFPSDDPGIHSIQRTNLDTLESNFNTDLTVTFPTRHVHCYDPIKNNVWMVTLPIFGETISATVKAWKGQGDALPSKRKEEVLNQESTSLASYILYLLELEVGKSGYTKKLVNPTQSKFQSREPFFIELNAETFKIFINLIKLSNNSSSLRRVLELLKLNLEKVVESELNVNEVGLDRDTLDSLKDALLELFFSKEYYENRLELDAVSSILSTAFNLFFPTSKQQLEIFQKIESLPKLEFFHSNLLSIAAKNLLTVSEETDGNDVQEREKILGSFFKKITDELSSIVIGDVKQGSEIVFASERTRSLERVLTSTQRNIFSSLHNNKDSSLLKQLAVRYSHTVVSNCVSVAKETSSIILGENQSESIESEVQTKINKALDRTIVRTVLPELIVFLNTVESGIVMEENLISSLQELRVLLDKLISSPFVSEENKADKEKFDKDNDIFFIGTGYSHYDNKTFEGATHVSVHIDKTSTGTFEINAENGPTYEIRCDQVTKPLIIQNTKIELALNPPKGGTLRMILIPHGNKEEEKENSTLDLIKSLNLLVGKVAIKQITGDKVADVEMDNWMTSNIISKGFQAENPMPNPKEKEEELFLKNLIEKGETKSAAQDLHNLLRRSKFGGEEVDKVDRLCIASLLKHLMAVNEAMAVDVRLKQVSPKVEYVWMVSNKLRTFLIQKIQENKMKHSEEEAKEFSNSLLQKTTELAKFLLKCKPALEKTAPKMKASKVFKSFVQKVITTSPTAKRKEVAEKESKQEEEESVTSIRRRRSGSIHRVVNRNSEDSQMSSVSLSQIASTMMAVDKWRNARQSLHRSLGDTTHSDADNSEEILAEAKKTADSILKFLQSSLNAVELEQELKDRGKLSLQRQRGYKVLDSLFRTCSLPLVKEDLLVCMALSFHSSRYYAWSKYTESSPDSEKRDQSNFLKGMFSLLKDPLLPSSSKVLTMNILTMKYSKEELAVLKQVEALNTLKKIALEGDKSESSTASSLILALASGFIFRSHLNPQSSGIQPSKEEEEVLFALQQETFGVLSSLLDSFVERFKNPNEEECEIYSMVKGESTMDSFGELKVQELEWIESTIFLIVGFYQQLIDSSDLKGENKESSTSLNVNRHTLASKNFVSTLFKLIGFNPRVSRVVIKMLRTIVPVLESSFLNACVQSLNGNEENSAEFERAMLNFLGKTLSKLNGESELDLNSFIQKDAYSNWCLGSELVGFFRYIMPTKWKTSLQNLFQSCIVEENEDKSKVFAVLSILGGHLEVARVGGRVQSIDYTGKTVEGTVLDMNPYSSTGTITLYTEVETVRLSQHSRDLIPSPEVPFDSSYFKFNEDSLSTVSKILSNHDESVASKQLKCVALKSVLSFAEQNRKFIELLKKTDIPSIVFQRSLTPVQSSHVFASFKKMNAEQLTLKNEFQLSDRRKYLKESKKEKKEDPLVQLYLDANQSELDQINNSADSEEQFVKDLMSFERLQFERKVAEPTYGNPDNYLPEKKDTDSIMSNIEFKTNSNGMWVGVKDDPTRSPGRLYKVKKMEGDFQVNIPDSETGITRRIMTSYSTVVSDLDYSLVGIQSPNPKQKLDLESASKNLEDLFTFICRDSVYSFIQSLSSSSDAVEVSKKTFGPFVEEFTKVLRLFASNEIDLPTYPNFWPSTKCELPGEYPPKYILSSQAKEMTETFRSILLSHNEELTSEISKDLPKAIEGSLVAPCLILDSTKNKHNRNQLLRFNNRGNYLITFDPNAEFNGDLTLHNDLCSATEQLEFNNMERIKPMLVYPFMSYKLESKGEYKIRITPIGSGIQISDSLAVSDGNFSYVHWLLDVVCKGNLERATEFLSRELVLSLFKYCKAQMSPHKQFAFKWLSKLCLNKSLSDKFIQESDQKEFKFFKKLLFSMFKAKKSAIESAALHSPFFVSLFEFVLSSKSFWKEDDKEEEKKSEEEKGEEKEESQDKNEEETKEEESTVPETSDEIVAEESKEEETIEEKDQVKEGEEEPKEETEETKEENNEEVKNGEEVKEGGEESKEEGAKDEVTKEDDDSFHFSFGDLSDDDDAASFSLEDFFGTSDDTWFEDVENLQKLVDVFLPLNERSTKDWRIVGGDLESNPLKKQIIDLASSKTPFETSHPLKMKDSMKEETKVKFEGANKIKVEFDSKCDLALYTTLVIKDSTGESVFTSFLDWSSVEVDGDELSYQLTIKPEEHSKYSSPCAVCKESSNQGIMWLCLSGCKEQLCNACYESTYITKENESQHDKDHIFARLIDQLKDDKASYDTVSVVPSTEEKDHSKHKCSGECGNPILSSIRWKCGTCSNFNLCQECDENRTYDHDYSHVLIKVPFPIDEKDEDSVKCELKQNTNWGISMTFSPRYPDSSSEKMKDTLEIFEKEMSRWTWEDDRALVKYLNELGEDLSSSSFSLPSVEKIHSTSKTLSKFNGESIKNRFTLLKELSESVCKCLPYINLSGNRVNYSDAEMDSVDFTCLPIGDKILAVKELIFLDTKGQFFKRVIPTIECFDWNIWTDDIRLVREDSKSGKETLFSQAIKQIDLEGNVWYLERPFSVAFEGEGAIDGGGPFNEAITAFSDEIQTPALPLFVLCPNGVGEVGFNREKMIPNPQRNSPTDLRMYEFIGKLLGVSFKNNIPMSLDLPTLFWKKLMKVPVGRNELREIDQICCQSLDMLMEIEKEGITESTFTDAISFSFTTITSDGREVELIEGGKDKPVTWKNRQEYCRAVEDFRLGEFDKQIDAIRAGMKHLFYHALEFCTWEEFQFKICGKEEINLDQLKLRTTYDRVDKNDPHIEYFWKALESFTNAERSAFLRFVWGRSRLPVSLSDFGREFTITQFDQKGNPDNYLPVSHTCHFQLDLPKYSSYEKMREKLLYSVTECNSIDNT